ncbi:hypothetical protein K469DRAFT_739173 [Zopfia rhizophila CBS 207.26]|uniref:Altered inheritance of mitochondria protein 9, mitochondrial n=1 Tax=Zopfia rhizophila CBS 207.26 TaxID=1314779 RepID=A0A6A6E2D7_9PEZI|nr:hypothetical protein K469DRAFT_739173 [Zopfia rhizophila CBS 207.26]
MFSPDYLESLDLDPYNYTAGHWLHRDREEREVRYIKFDFDALRRRVVEVCDGATAIASYEKKEGTANRVFIFTTNNGKRLVAKVPFRLGIPSGLVIRSEVATVKFLQTNTSIPMPKILDWSIDVANAVGTEYIIMEHASGVQLDKKWDHMSPDQKIKCIQGIHEKLTGMVDIDFLAYGSIYDSAYPSESEQETVPFKEGFCIGPHLDLTYWDGFAGDEKYYHQMKPNRGPWKSFEAYCNARIDSSISCIPPSTSPNRPASNLPSWHGSPQSHIDLLESLRDVLKAVSNDPNSERILDASKPTLYCYLPKRHIFVSDTDPTIITSIIDFQTACIDAPFMYASSFITFLEPKDPPDSEDVIYIQVFIQSIMQNMPKLLAPMAVSQNFFRPFATCDMAWKQGAASLRHALQELSGEWERLGLASPCPVPAIPESEAKQHHVENAKCTAALRTRMTFAKNIGCRPDGWVSAEKWEETVLACVVGWNAFSSMSGMTLEEDIVLGAQDL